MQKLVKYFNGLTETEQIQLIKSTSQELNRTRTRLDKALKTELETPSNCSRARRTTLYANSQKITDQYNGLIRDLKIYINLI